MKTVIFYKRFKDTEGNPLVNPIIVKDNGDWIDLSSSKDITMPAPIVTSNGVSGSATFAQCLIPLGIAMKLPKGYEAILANRSSTGRKKNIMLVNGEGIIDNSFSGNEDQWHFPAIAIGDVNIKANDPFCQFRIQLNQFATKEDKLNWLESEGIELVEVEELDGENRGGGCIRAEKEAQSNL